MIIFKRSAFKIIIISKMREKWSWIGAWLNVHKDLTHRERRTYVQLHMAHIWRQTGAWLQQHNSKALFGHLKRVKGVLRHA